MLIDIISIMQILRSALNQTLEGLAALTAVSDADVLKDRDSKKNYAHNHGIILKRIINRLWKPDARLSSVRLQLIRTDPLFMRVYLSGTIVIYRQRNQNNSKHTGHKT